MSATRRSTAPAAGACSEGGGGVRARAVPSFGGRGAPKLRADEAGGAGDEDEVGKIHTQAKVRMRYAGPCWLRATSPLRASAIPRSPFGALGMTTVTGSECTPGRMSFRPSGVLREASPEGERGITMILRCRGAPFVDTQPGSIGRRGNSVNQSQLAPDLAQDADRSIDLFVGGGGHIGGAQQALIRRDGRRQDGVGVQAGVETLLPGQDRRGHVPRLGRGG